MMTIDAATALDIPAIMRLERGHGSDRFVGRWDASQHAAEMALPGSHYLVSRRDGEALGFVLLQRLDDDLCCGLLRRIAVARPGEGLGAPLLDAALAHAFAATPTHRLQLHCHPDNEIAKRAYAKAGFAVEGLLRDFRRLPDGGFRSMVLMSLLRPEWELRRRQTERAGGDEPQILEPSVPKRA